MKKFRCDLFWSLENLPPLRQLNVSIRTASYFTWAVAGHVTPLHSLCTHPLTLAHAHPPHWLHSEPTAPSPLSFLTLQAATGTETCSTLKLQMTMLCAKVCRKASRVGGNFFSVSFHKNLHFPIEIVWHRILRFGAVCIKSSWPGYKTCGLARTLLCPL